MSLKSHDNISNFKKWSIPQNLNKQHRKQSDNTMIYTGSISWSTPVPKQPSLRDLLKFLILYN